MEYLNFLWILVPTETGRCALLSFLEEPDPGISPFRNNFLIISKNLLHFKVNPIKGLAFGF